MDPQAPRKDNANSELAMTVTLTILWSLPLSIIPLNPKK
jgi:hypothetical protein